MFIPEPIIHRDLFNQLQYPVITICSSTRFRNEIIAATGALTYAGWLVFPVGLSSDGKRLDDTTEFGRELKQRLIDVHKQKIRMSDAIYVVNIGGYIGESVSSEIEYANSIGVKIYYAEEVR